MLDPIADKLLVAATLLMLVHAETIQSWSIWAAIVILCREILVSGLREFLAELRVSVPVTALAKWKTTVQLVAIGFLIAGPAGEAVLPGTVTHRPFPVVDRSRAHDLYGMGLHARRHEACDRRRERGGKRRKVAVKLSYFAWVRERIGKAEEEVELPPHVTTINDLLVWLKGRGEEYAHAFEQAK